ncbi:MAG: 4Fe-4S binding protein [Candidatus Latescibacteria bacterium]|nr:4Fe-4S binding protein [Candidatus Latescibacterota bacterium]
MAIHKLQAARRTTQIVALAIVLAIPALSRYGNYLSARQLDRNLRKWDGTLQGASLGAIDRVLRLLPGGEKRREGDLVRHRERVLTYVQQVRGGPWSVQLGDISLTDPLAGAESIAASKRLASVLVVSLLIPVFLTLLLGRVFCSWICPMGLLLELVDKLRGLLRFLELPPRDLHFSRRVKTVLLCVGLVMAGITAVPVLGYVYPPAILGREAHDLVFAIFDRAEQGRFGFWAGGLTWMSLLLAGIALFEATVSRRWWCRYVCPGGALYALLGRARPVRVRFKAAQCTDCGLCEAVCPMGLRPKQEGAGPECDNCGLCVSHCGGKALNLEFRIGRQAPQSEAGPTSARLRAG